MMQDMAIAELLDEEAVHYEIRVEVHEFAEA